MQNSDVNLDTGDVQTRKGSGVLRTSAIGSCVVVSAYDSQSAVGGMAHVMLPGSAPDCTAADHTRYAADAVDALLTEMKGLGVRFENLVVCLVGGGNLLGGDHAGPGPEIVESLIELLSAKEITPVATEVGGVERRSCTLNVSCGRVTYTVGDSEKQTLWEAAEEHPWTSRKDPK